MPLRDRYIRYVIYVAKFIIALVTYDDTPRFKLKSHYYRNRFDRANWISRSCAERATEDGTLDAMSRL